MMDDNDLDNLTQEMWKGPDDQTKKYYADLTGPGLDNDGHVVHPDNRQPTFLDGDAEFQLSLPLYVSRADNDSPG